MKKILSVALSTAMAFSMFASVAFGADAKLTPEQQFNALKEAGIVSGFPDGLSHLEKTLTRAELAKIIVNAIDLEPVTGVATYKDKNYSASHWAAPFIEAATAAGILQGKDTVKGLFDPSGNVTVQELAKVLVTALELEVPADANNTASAWAKGYVAAAVKAGYIADGINYQAAATRSQAVVAAHAIYEANQVPTVKSYKVVDPKNVEVTMSNGETVKVALETALEANKETEIKFTYQDREYTTKVTYETTVAQKIQSVKADNLKEVVVTFDGTVDKETATNENNYSISGKSLESATLSEDKTSVTLLLAEGSSLTSQREAKLVVSNVANEDNTKKFNETVTFTAIDVVAPTVKEVVGLGTKAFKVVFSEPVSKTEAQSSTNYRIDGKAIAASVDYAYPNTVIVKTNLTEGKHTLRVSGVKDFSGLQVAPIENEFEVVADTTAPEIVSIEASDLNKLTVTFNEPIKSVAGGYANTSSKKLKVSKISDTKVSLVFDDSDHRLTTGENTIHLDDVKDYSDNVADREGKVTPELDTVRPAVLDVDFDKDSDGHFRAEIQFSEDVESASALDEGNYKLVDGDGKVADIAGVDADGHPVRDIAYARDSKGNTLYDTVVIDFGTSFGDTYTLEIEDVQDDAVIKNTMLPYSVKLDPAGTEDGEIDRVWVDTVNGDRYVYIEFNSNLSVDSIDHAKFSYDVANRLADGTVQPGFARTGVELTDDDSNIDLINGDTIRILTDKVVREGDEINANYIVNQDGEYLNDGDYLLEKVVGGQEIAATGNAEATAADTITVEFDTALSIVDEDDFVILKADGTSYSSVSDAKLSSNGKKLTLELRTDLAAKNFADGDYLVATVSSNTQDEFGNALDLSYSATPANNKAVTVVDKIAPAKDTVSFTVTGATYNVVVSTDQLVRFNPAYGYSNTPVTDDIIKDLFEVQVAKSSDNVTIYSITVDGNQLTVNFSTGFTLNNGVEVQLKLKSNNNVIEDPKGNDLKTFTVTKITTGL